jgi:Sporulation protein YtfJ (Spore_YtfJ)
MMATQPQERLQLVDELLERIGQTVGDKANVSTVFGDPVEREGVTVIPVAKARFGFGGGGGSGAREGQEGSGGGGGGGAYVEVRAAGAEFKRIQSPMDMLAFVAAASLAVLALKRLLTE